MFFSLPSPGVQAAFYLLSFFLQQVGWVKNIFFLPMPFLLLPILPGLIFQNVSFRMGKEKALYPSTLGASYQTVFPWTLVVPCCAARYPLGRYWMFVFLSPEFCILYSIL
jgi:hypothetical protein